MQNIREKLSLLFKESIKKVVSPEMKPPPEPEPTPETDALMARLKRASITKDLPQIRESDEDIINNFRSRAARKTIKDLPLLVTPEQNNSGLGASLKKHSESYHRLHAFVNNVPAEELAEGGYIADTEM